MDIRELYDTYVQAGVAESILNRNIRKMSDEEFRVNLKAIKKMQDETKRKLYDLLDGKYYQLDDTHILVVTAIEEIEIYVLEKFADS